MVSMSLGLRKLRGSRPAERPAPAPVPSGTPSTTYSGSLLAFTDVGPRILSDKPPPGSLLSTTCTPGTLLWMRSCGLRMRPVLNCESVTAVTAPVMSPARCTP